MSRSPTSPPISPRVSPRANDGARMCLRASALAALALALWLTPASAAAQAAAPPARGTVSGTLPCQQSGRAPWARCAFVLAPTPGGHEAQLQVTFPDGTTRRLMFGAAGALRADPTMAGAGRDTGWHCLGTQLHLRADDQRFVLGRAHPPGFACTDRPPR